MDPTLSMTSHPDPDSSQSRSMALRAGASSDGRSAPKHDIQALRELDLDGLRAHWSERYGSAPKLRSVELLRLCLAWRLQADVRGGLDRGTRRQLERRGRLRTEGLELGVGARLRREWQGRIIEVVVESDGFRWEGRKHPAFLPLRRRSRGRAGMGRGSSG